MLAAELSIRVVVNWEHTSPQLVPHEPRALPERLKVIKDPRTKGGEMSEGCCEIGILR